MADEDILTARRRDMPVASPRECPTRLNNKPRPIQSARNAAFPKACNHPSVSFPSSSGAKCGDRRHVDGRRCNRPVERCGQLDACQHSWRARGNPRDTSIFDSALQTTVSLEASQNIKNITFTGKNSFTLITSTSQPQCLVLSANGLLQVSGTGGKRSATILVPITLLGNYEFNAIGGSLAVGTVTSAFGTLTLNGDATSLNTLSIYDGRSPLTIAGGHWTLVGNNHAASWATVVRGGTFLISSTGSPASGQIEILSGATFIPGTGTLIPNVKIHGGGTLSMADGRIGTTTLTIWNPLGGTQFDLVYEIGSQGADKLVVKGNTLRGNSMKNRVVLAITGAIHPGTYTIADFSGDAALATENHLGFGFTGDPADHRNIVRTTTSVYDGTMYRFTIDTSDGTATGGTGYGLVAGAGAYTQYTLKVEIVSPASRSAPQAEREP